jgi:hypothetical protein
MITKEKVGYVRTMSYCKRMIAGIDGQIKKLTFELGLGSTVSEDLIDGICKQLKSLKAESLIYQRILKLNDEDMV